MYTNDKTAKTDMRVVRTRKLLAESLFLLMEERPFESITVQEICDRAMVHRTTFYKHFTDKYQLLSFAMEQSMAAYAAIRVRERLMRPISSLQLSGQLRRMRAWVESEQEDRSLNGYLHRCGLIQLVEDLKAVENPDRPFPIPVEAIAAFYSGATIGLLSWWLRDGAKLPADQVDDYLNRMIDRSFFIAE